MSARGFGIGRMMLPVEECIELPHTKPIPLPPLQEQFYMPDGTPDQVQTGTILNAHIITRTTWLRCTRRAKKTSLNLNGLAMSRTGTTLLASCRIASRKCPNPKPNFQLVRLELVSLLKHETPVAYVSKHLPQMDELRDAPTRPLDDFERHALDRLRSDEDLVIDDAPNRIRMVGSLRAGKDCMECHSVRRGELLGAFSYELIGGRAEGRVEPGA